MKTICKHAYPADLCGICNPVAKEPSNARRSTAACSGFCVVGRHASLGFTAVTNPDLSRGFRFEEIWIFGTPQTHREIMLSRAVEPNLNWMSPDSIHRIPNAIGHAPGEKGAANE